MKHDFFYVNILSTNISKITFSDNLNSRVSDNLNSRVCSYLFLEIKQYIISLHSLQFVCNLMSLVSVS